jgi:SH3-like domain-containing protein
MARTAAPRRSAWRLSLAAWLALAAGAHANPLPGPDSGKPVPRYESLKFAAVNGRRGPGMDQQVLWTFHRRGLPVRIVAESGPWRRIADPEGDLSWVSAAALEARRGALVIGAKPAALRRDPRRNARIVALLAPGNVGQIRACRGAWRAVKIGQWGGWIEAASLWGADDCGAGGG